MTPKQFYDLVVDMRKAQKRYFALRKQGAPREVCEEAKNYSIGIERQIDAEIKRVEDIQKNGLTLNFDN